MQDRSISLVDQDHMVEDLKHENALMRVLDVDSDHCPFLCMPDELPKTISDVMQS